jgi:hypothetical protein
VAPPGSDERALSPAGKSGGKAQRPLDGAEVQIAIGSIINYTGLAVYI